MGVGFIQALLVFFDGILGLKSVKMSSTAKIQCGWTALCLLGHMVMFQMTYFTAKQCIEVYF